MKTVTTSKDKEKYGLKLKADLDFQRLGRRLKQDFKKVQEAIKCMFPPTLTLLEHQKDKEIYELYIQGVPKECPGHIWCVNDNLIHAHIYRLPQVGFATFFYWFKM